jgi:hypothetical protein
MNMPLRKRVSVLRRVVLVAALSTVGAVLASGQTAITTHHYDNHRTGWNQNETTLTPANVGSTSFGT